MRSCACACACAFCLRTLPREHVRSRMRARGRAFALRFACAHAPSCVRACMRPRSAREASVFAFLQNALGWRGTLEDSRGAHHTRASARAPRVRNRQNRKRLREVWAARLMHRSGI
eukprot:356586-Pleurochrysis_carterae.AAC.1